MTHASVSDIIPVHLWSLGLELIEASNDATREDLQKEVGEGHQVYQSEHTVAKVVAGISAMIDMTALRLRTENTTATRFTTNL